MAEFTFGEVDAVLAAMNDIAHHKRVAFTGRLKFLLKHGLPTGPRPGRGKAATYSFAELMQLAVAVEFMQAGVDQKRAARLVQFNWTAIRYPVYLGTFTETEAAEIADRSGQDVISTHWVLLVNLHELSALTVDGSHEYDDYEAVHPVNIDDVSSLLAGMGASYSSERRRTLVIDVGNLAAHAAYQTAFAFKFATVSELRDDLTAEADAEQRSIEAAAAAIRADTAKTKLMPPELKAKLAANLRRLDETDFSTNPPTSPEVTEKRARDMIARLTQPAKDALFALARGQKGDGSTSIEMTAESRAGMAELGDYGVYECDEGDGFALTILGRVALRVLIEEKTGGSNVSSEA